MKKAPCAGDGMELCKERYPGCHDHCERFRQWKEERNKEFLFNYEKNQGTPISDANLRRSWRNLRRRNERATNKNKMRRR